MTDGRCHLDTLAGDDAVYVDYQPTNLLTDLGCVTGVVDWDGAGRGDRRLDLVTLCFGLPGTSADPAAVRRLDEVLDGIPEQRAG